MNSVIMRRKEVMELLGYKSTKGFCRFVAKTPTFPKEQRSSTSFSGHVFYPRRAVMIWLKNNGFIDALA